VRIKTLVLVVLVFAAVSASKVEASTFTLSDYTVNYNTSDPGLVLWESDIYSGLSFDLTKVGDSFTSALFRIGTSDSWVNFEDLKPQDIDVNFTFTSPPPAFGGTTSGISGALGLWSAGVGYVLWDNPLVVAFGSTGLLSISLSNAMFSMPGAATIYATFELVRADTISNPEPATLMLIGLGVLMTLAVSRRAAWARR
jgi:hypothetical protein